MRNFWTLSRNNSAHCIYLKPQQFWSECWLHPKARCMVETTQNWVEMQFLCLLRSLYHAWWLKPCLLTEHTKSKITDVSASMWQQHCTFVGDVLLKQFPKMHYGRKEVFQNKRHFRQNGKTPVCEHLTKEIRILAGKIWLMENPQLKSYTQR